MSNNCNNDDNGVFVEDGDIEMDALMKKGSSTKTKKKCLHKSIKQTHSNVGRKACGYCLLIFGCLVFLAWVSEGYIVNPGVFMIIGAMNRLCGASEIGEIYDVHEYINLTCPKCQNWGSMELYKQNVETNLWRKRFHCRHCGQKGRASELDMPADGILKDETGKCVGADGHERSQSDGNGGSESPTASCTTLQEDGVHC